MASAHLKSLYPGRETQIDILLDLLGLAHEGEPAAPSIYVHGGPSTGKTSIVRSMLQVCNTRHAFVNLVECYSSRILFEAILNQLVDHHVDPATGEPFARCENMMEFILKLQSVEVALDGAVVVLDKAEELRNMDFNLFPGFLRLGELSGLSISVVLISEVIFERYYSRLGVIEPIKVYFPQYNKEGLLEVLSADFSYAKELIGNNYSEENLNIDLDFYRNYLNAFLSVFFRVCRDVSELRHMSRVNFLKYCRPVLDTDCSITDTMTLWRRIAPILKSSLEVLYLRVSTDSTEEKNSKTLNLELPFYAKYLLVAAYLASYNSTKDDKRIFMKYHGKKTKTIKDVKRKSKVSEQLNTQLGPKPFTLDRLLAIFYSILEDKVGFNNNLLVQVSSMVELQLLTAVADGCALDGQKYKCNVNFDFIQGVSRMVGINIRKYLSDFSHV